MEKTSREPYYTNSTQLPVDYTDDLFEAVELQDPLQTKYTGGTVLHAFIGEKLTGENAKLIIRTIFSKFGLPYLSVSPTFSICPEHGYIQGEHFECPTCGKKAEVWARIVGYMRPVQQWNKGKVSEYKDRKTFKVDKKRAE